MTPREKPTEPREAPKKNTSPVLKLFVYGTLKRGYWNHDPFCWRRPLVSRTQRNVPM